MYKRINGERESDKDREQVVFERSDVRPEPARRADSADSVVSPVWHVLRM